MLIGNAVTVQARAPPHQRMPPHVFHAACLPCLTAPSTPPPRPSCMPYRTAFQVLDSTSPVHGSNYRQRLFASFGPVCLRVCAPRYLSAVRDHAWPSARARLHFISVRHKLNAARLQVAEWLGRRLKRPYGRKFIPTENDLQVRPPFPRPPPLRTSIPALMPPAPLRSCSQHHFHAVASHPQAPPQPQQPCPAFALWWAHCSVPAV